MQTILKALDPATRGKSVTTLHIILETLGLDVPTVDLGTQSIGSGTTEAIKQLQGELSLHETGVVDRETARRINTLIKRRSLEGRIKERLTEVTQDPAPTLKTPLVVAGRVTDAMGRPAKAKIQILRIGFRNETEIASTGTDKNGRFELEIDTSAQDGALSIVAAARLGDQHLRSALVHDASGRVVIDLTAAPRPVPLRSALDDIKAAVTPLIGTVGLAELKETDTQNDISFLAAERNLDPERLAGAVIAGRVGQAAKLPTEVVYAFIAQHAIRDLPPDLAAPAPSPDATDLLDETVLAGIVSLSPQRQRKFLADAVAADLIPLEIGDKIDDFLKQLDGLRAQVLRTSRFGPGKASLDDVLGITALTKRQKNRFVELQIEAQTSDKPLWQLVEEDTVISAARVQDLRYTLTLGSISKNHLPFMRAAKKHLPDTLHSNPGLVASLSVEGWKAIIKETLANDSTVLPDNIEGETHDDRIGAFAQMLSERAEQNFPSVATIARVTAHPDIRLKNPGALVDLVNKVPDFDLRALNISAIRLDAGRLEGRGAEDKTLINAVASIKALPEDAVSDLKTTQRAMRLAPGANAAASLIASGHVAAHHINDMGRANFTKAAVAAGMTQMQAAQTFGRAQASYGYLLARFLDYRIDLDKASPLAIGSAWKVGDLVAEVDSDISLRMLFGSLDACECNWCESIHGPAAYFTEILRWLGQRNARTGSGFASARNVLRARRPDLMDMLLNCANTDTLMPYIDLVNEILEEAVAPTGAIRNTTWSSALLMAEPEHVNPAAYAALATARHAPGLPFDLPHHEAHLFLTHLQVPRHTIMRVFRTADASAQAASYFGLSQDEAAIIATSAPGAQATFWAMTVPGELVPNAAAQTLMARADISYDVLAQVLATQFANSSTPVSSFQPEYECDLFERQVINLSAARLDRMNRFIRLWRKTGWKIWELDLAIMALGGTLVAATLPDLMRIDRLVNARRMTVEEAVAMVAPLNTRLRDDLTGDGKVLYVDLFQNLAVQNPADSDLSIAAVTDAAPPARLEHKANLIAASLGLARSSLDLLMPAASDPSVALPQAGEAASLRAVSQIWRFARLVRALDVSISDLLAYCRISGAPLDASGRVDPFQSLGALESFIAGYERHAASGLTVPQTRHIVTYWPETPLGMSDADLGAALADFRLMLADLQAQTITPPEERSAALARQLPGVPGFASAEISAVAIAIVEDSFAGTLAQRNAFITAHFGEIMPVASAIAAFAPYGGPPDGRDAAIDARRLTLLRAVYQALARRVVTVTLAGILGVEDSIAAHLAWQVAHPVSGALGPHLLSADFLQRNADDSAYARDTTRGDMGDLFTVLSLLDKIGMVAQIFGWSSTRLIWMLDNGGQFGLPDLRALPVAPGAPPLPYGQWDALIRWSAAMDRYPETDVLSLGLLLRLIGSPGYDITQLGEDLAVWTQSRDNTLSPLFTALGLGYPADFWDVAQIERLFEALEILRKTGVPAAQVAGWGGAALSLAQSHEIKLAAKARYDLKDWLEIAEPVQNVLREAKRTALATFLTSRPGADRFATVDAIYAHYLIDPQMSSCRKTSRLVQATGSVQLFIQRCLMNLEQHVLADEEIDDAWNQWKWMSTYRVWEGARKVFLWPENVIRPELNSDKSPQFLELEQKLSQGDLTAENAEIALEGYLETLDAISSLIVLATHQDSSSKGRTIRVLARTKAEPPDYYYREQFLPQGAESGAWSAWRKLSLDINGEPFFGYVNRKIHIFWLTFVAKPNPSQRLPSADVTPFQALTALQMWEIQLNWSVLRQGQWQAPRMGARKLFLTEFRPQHSFHIRTQSYSGGRLAINIFASTSPEFNNARVTVFVPPFRIEQRPQDPRQTFHSTLVPPVHLGRFVFGRDVDEVQLTNRNSLHSTLVSTSVFGQEAAQTRLLQNWGVQRLPVPQEMMHRYQTMVNIPANTSRLYVTGPSTNALRIQEDALLRRALTPLRVLPASNFLDFDSMSGIYGSARARSDNPFFYIDRQRSFFVRPQIEWRDGGSFSTVQPSMAFATQFRMKYRFDRFYHPFTGFFLDRLAVGGLPGFYRRSTQIAPPSDFTFSTYQPHALVTPDHARDVVDFGYAASYGQYNWELFFHVPWLIANKLAENQKFDEALDYLRYVFNPTNASGQPAPQRYWITKPFFQNSAADYNAQRIERLLEMVNTGSSTHIAQVEAWRNDPFDPHKIARLRPVAYQRAIVMAYIGVLMDWGDREFRRFTTESLNLAALYYTRASELLGPRPETVPVDRRTEEKSFNQISADLDAFGNVLAEVENLLPPPAGGAAGGGTGGTPLPPTTLFYFCIPGNDKLLDHWDRLERNLFNLRNCRDIDGIARPLPLFAPPIDPSMLVRAAAAGVDLSSLAGGGGVALPHYRFRFMIQRAYAFAAEVERLGAALLQALQSRDAAALEELRETHLAELHMMMRDTAELRIEEAKAYEEALTEARGVIDIRKQFFEQKKDTWASPLELTGFLLKTTSFLVKGYAVVAKAAAGGIKLVPQFQVGASGVGGSPHASGVMGGEQLGESVDKFGDSMAAIGGLLDKGAELSFKTSYFFDRQKKYKHEYEKAAQELVEIDKRLEAARITVELTEAEHRTQERQIEQARSISAFLTSRYTNKALYDWMVSTISGVYFQAYTLAYDMALAAGACAEREVMLSASDYVSFGYWDSLRKGLLAGEKLSLDLRKLEAAYIQRNKRSYEISKDVALSLVDAEALLDLRSTGACEFELPEMLYDMDHPGHYKRRIRTVAITIPTAAGAYTSVNGKLTLLHDETRISLSLDGGYARDRAGDDRRFVDNWSATRAIVTSKAVNDPGLHELSLNDDRYLPFEGAGAIGRWRLELPKDTNAFGLDDVTDAVLHIRYTAEEGGATLASEARQTASQMPMRTGTYLMRLDQAMAAEWADLLAPPADGQDQEMTLRLGRERLPYLDRQRTVKVTAISLTALGASADMLARITAPGDQVADIAMVPQASLTNRIGGDTGGSFAAGVSLGDFRLRLRRATALDFRSLVASDLSGLYAVVSYEATP